MDKLIAITDLHITNAQQDIIGLDPLARFQAVLQAALADHSDAKAIVLMGDLTHHGTPDQYARLAEALADCQLPVIPLLGNHDRRDAFLAAFPATALTDTGHVQAVLDLPHHRVITLDTLDGPPYPVGHHAGQLCADRLEWLRHALEGAGDRMPLVFMHHPPMLTGIAGMDAIRLADGDVFLNMLAGYQPLHLFCGHLHRTVSGTTAGIGWTIFKSPCHQGVLDFGDSNSSLSIDEPGAYGVILLPPGGVIAHSEDVGLHAPVFHDTGSATG